jgi:hypothetical protein
MKALGGRGGIAPTLLDLGTRWGWVVSVTPRPRFTPGTDCTGGWVGPKPGLDTEARGKILCPCRGSNPDRPVVQSVVRHYTDWATPALYKTYMPVQLPQWHKDSQWTPINCRIKFASLWTPQYEHGKGKQTFFSVQFLPCIGEALSSRQRTILSDVILCFISLSKKTLGVGFTSLICFSPHS